MCVPYDTGTQLTGINTEETPFYVSSLKKLMYPRRYVQTLSQEQFLSFVISKIWEKTITGRRFKLW